MGDPPDHLEAVFFNAAVNVTGVMLRKGLG
jgi:hypothetical protein